VSEAPLSRGQARLLWGALAALFLGVLGLVGALALGWNNPRPPGAPDWEAPGLPLALEAAPQSAAAQLLGPGGRDFSYEVEAAPEAGPAFNGYGLLYRAQDATHGYVLAVGSDGYYALLRLEGGAETALVEWQQFPHVRRGRAANRLRVRCAGPACALYINDEYAATVSDDTWLEGEVGLWVRAFEDEPVRVAFAAARLWRVEARDDAGG
jgi:hypothetical protein